MNKSLLLGWALVGIASAVCVLAICLFMPRGGLVELDLPAGATITLPAIYPADPGAYCRRLSQTVKRVNKGEPADECDLRNLVEAEGEIEYLRGIRDREGGWCWDELELCEAGVATERACNGYEMTRWDEVIDDLDACARSVEETR